MILTQAEHGDLILERLADGQSYRAIAREIGCSKDTVAKYVLINHPERHRAPGPPPEPQEPGPSELDVLRAKLAEVRAQASRARSTDAHAELLIQEVRAAVTPADVRYEAPDDAEGAGKHHMHVLLLSDLHVGEVVSREATNGLNEYNWEIFQERMASVQSALRSFQNSRPYPIDELLIADLGDKVSNGHHHELAVTNEFGVAEQCHRVGVFMGQWIEAIVPDYPSIRVVGVGGNHGRVHQKPQSKQVFDSFDWLAGQYTAQYLTNYDTVTLRFPRSGMAIEEVAGKNMLLWHGDGVKSNMPGVPWGGVMRRWNELRKSYGEGGTALSYVAVGHFHQENAVARSVFMNGSLIGLNEHGLKEYGGGATPCQLLLTFCKDTQRLTDVSYLTP